MNPDQIQVVKQSLEVMGIGMAGIFIVVAGFYGLIVLLQKIFPPKNKE